MTGEARAWGWVAHLSGGGTCPWREWSGAAAVREAPLPGAQHLELLRRLNAARTTPAALVDLVLAASPPGRGQPQLDLVGVSEHPGFGAPPVDPSQLPAEELVRLGTGVLAELAVAAPLPAVADPVRPRRWRSTYRLTGNPYVAAAVRRDLAAQGRPPGGAPGKVLVLLTDHDTHLADVWSARAGVGTVRAWEAWLDRLADADAPGEVAPRADVLARVRGWASRVGVERVHLVLDPAAAGPLVGGTTTAPPGRLSHAALELARHTANTLRVSVDGPRRDLLMRRVVHGWLREADRGAGLPAPGVPARHREWVDAEARRLRDALLADGYPVHGGTLDRLLPARGGRTSGPGPDDVLGVLVRALHTAAPPTGGTT